MNPLDEQLKAALRRKDPSADFERRLMEQIACRPDARPAWWRALYVKPAPLRWATAGLALVLITGFGTAEYRRYRGEQAKQQLIEALEIASLKLKWTEQKVNGR